MLAIPCPGAGGQACLRRSRAPARLVGATTMAVAVTLSTIAFPSMAAVQEFFVTGTKSASSSFTGIADGTPYAGTYAFDDATADTNGGDAQLGNYATGEFFVDFGPTIGQITFDQGATTLVEDSVLGFGGFTTDDAFRILAGEGARNTPGIPNDIQGTPSLLFRQSVLSGDPTALSDDTLTGVPHVAGAPWDANDQLISVQFSAVGGGCPAFTSNCNMRLDVETVDPAHLLTLNTTGTGSGSVASAPFGIDCGGTCSALMGGTVVLTATPVDSTVNWTGCDSVNAAGDECTVDMNADRTVTAEFVGQFNLAVNKTGTGDGTVTSNPAGIDCGATCSASLGGTVVLTAVPVDSTVNWTGCDSVNPAGDECTVDMNADRAVTAEFEAIITEFDLTVNKTGTGNGTVTSNPAGIDCGATCSASLGGTVVLTAVPVDSTVNWTGCDSVNPAGDECTVDMTQQRAVTVQFEAIVVTPVPLLPGALAGLLGALFALLAVPALRVRRRL